MKQLIMISFFVLSLGCEQFNPRPDWKAYDKERTRAHAPQASLDEAGKLSGLKAGEESINADELYSSYCSNCHGAEGKGDGPGGAGTPPQWRKPRNFTNVAWQKSVNDDHILAVIVKGAVGAGLENPNPSMAPMGAIIDTEAKQKAMVAKIRSFGKQ